MSTVDQVWRGCVIPDDLLYDVQMHVWVALTADAAVLGMTDIAQSMGGRIVQVSWKKTGRRYARGRSLAVIESAKWVGPFPTPLTGDLVEVNSGAFAADIAIANRDPYGAGWMARIRPSALPEERDCLLGGRAAFDRYQELIEQDGIRCYRCSD